MNNLRIQDPKNPSKTILVARDLFTYKAEAASLAAGAELTDVIDFQADSSFVWLKTTYLVDNDTTQTPTTLIIPNLTVNLFDTGSGRNLQNSPMPISAIAGRGDLPYILPVPRVFQPKSSLSVTFANINTVDQYIGISFVLHGYKQWRLE
jgi:hypothetical protein